MINREFNIKTGLELDFVPELYFDESIQIEYINKILLDKCYFNKSFYTVDLDNRKIYTLDRRVTILINFDITNIKVEALYHLLSIMQLYLIKLLRFQDVKYYIDKYCSVLDLKVNYQSRRLVMSIIKRIFGQEIASLTIEICDQSFEFNLNSKQTVTRYLAFDPKFRDFTKHRDTS